MIPLGSMYFTPEVLEEDRALHCGGFVACLVSGYDVQIIAGDNEMRRLAAWLLERHGKKMVSKRVVVTKSFQLQTVSAVGID